jgi:hypothetical protein
MLGLKPDEFDNMSWGDFIRVASGYKIKEFQQVKMYRNLMGAAAGIDPRKIFELPGDYDHIPDPLTQEEMILQAKKLGYAHLLGIKEGEC